MSISDDLRRDLAAKRTTRDEKLQRVLTRSGNAVQHAAREAVEARAAADRAKAALERAKNRA
jgi:uncharacterized protein (DUF2236 family)